MNKRHLLAYFPHLMNTLTLKQELENCAVSSSLNKSNHTECLALNGNNIKYISNKKADIKLCAHSFSSVTLPAVCQFGQSHPGTCVWC